MQKTVYFSVLLLYCGFIFWLSDQSRLPTPDLFENEDKLHHFLAYFLMGVFAWHAFAQLNFRPGLLFLTSLVFCSLYGLSDEWHQSFVIGRDASYLDWLADTVGGGFAVFACYRRGKRHRLS